MRKKFHFSHLNKKISENLNENHRRYFRGRFFLTKIKQRTTKRFIQTKSQSDELISCSHSISSVVIFDHVAIYWNARWRCLWRVSKNHSIEIDRYSWETSRVVLAKNVNTNEFAAVKVIDINRLKGNDVVIRKEVKQCALFLLA